MGEYFTTQEKELGSALFRTYFLTEGWDKSKPTLWDESAPETKDKYYMQARLLMERYRIILKNNHGL